MTTTLIRFVLGGQACAVDVAHVREVQPLENMAPVPCTPPFVAGLINLRGSLYSVLDLALLFGLPPVGRGPSTRVMLVQAGGLEIGLLADRVESVQEVSLSEVAPPLAVHGGIRREYVRGLLGDSMALWLDLERICSDPRIIVNEAID